MPRPLLKSHNDVLLAVLQLASTHNPEDITFAKMADVTGLSGAALVKRFKTKKNLLLTATEFGYEQMIEAFRVAGGATGDPIEKIQRGLGALAKTVGADEAIGHGMAFLQLNVSDPDFNVIAQKGMQALRSSIKQHLKTAVEDNHLPKNVDTLRLASSILTTYNGTLITWALLREGQLVDVLRANIEEVLPCH